MSSDIKQVYVEKVITVHASADTGEVHYTCIIDGEEVLVTMDLFEAVHLHDKKYLKECLIKYIQKI
tara:strand:+ start:2590 stop:2787 length:198 start_codon:yes stop_codon:yes gene_type:complete